MDCFEVFYGQTSPILTFLLEITIPCPLGKRGGRPSSMLSAYSSKASISDVRGWIWAYGMGSLHVLEGTMNAERYIKVLEQHMLPSRWCLFQGRPCVFKQDNATTHNADITTAWLRSIRVLVLNWPACSQDLSPIENIWRIIKRKIRQRRPQTGNLLQARMWPNCNTKTPETPNLDAQTSSKLFWKEEKMQHHGKHAPIPTILRPVGGVKFEINSFCA